MLGRLQEGLATAVSVSQAAAVVCDHLVDAGMQMPSVYVEVAGRLRCVAQRGYWQVHDGIPSGVGILGATFRRGTPTITSDVRRSPDFIAAGEGVIGEATFPLRHRGQVVGCVNVESRHPLSEADIAVVRTSTVELEARLTELGGIPPETLWQLLARESAALMRLHEHGAISGLAVERALTLTGMTSAVLVLDDEDAHRVVAAQGPLGAVLRSLEPSTIAAIAEWTRSGASVYTVGSFPVSGFSGSAQIWGAGVQALVSVPVMGGERARGFLLVADGHPSQLATEEVQVLELFAAHLATALQGADAFAELRRQASHDTLTGLPHGAVFHDHLNEEMGGGIGDRAVLLIDLDSFKQVNDTQGHLVGDQVLVEVARSLQAALHEGDHLYRIGGDEFAALATAASDVEAVAIGERLCAAAAATGHVTVSVGVRRCTGGDVGQSADRVLSDADLALYEAKAHGRDRVRVYLPALRDAVLERAHLAAELAGAIRRGELYLDYQPIIDLRSRRMIGAEALIRWRHPHRGVVGPDDFIRVAEKDGQIVEIGAWVVAQATAQAAAWRRATGVPLVISVNMSGLQLQPAFVDLVSDALRRADLPPEALLAEITESALVDEAERIEVLADLRALGVRVAVDDFGTGYSSLSYLRRRPIDVVKIDRSFVAELEDQRNAAVARTIIDLAHTLDLECIAEGVERAEQVEQLRGMDCRLAQGYWFCRPTAPAEVAAMALGLAALGTDAARATG